MFIQPACCQPGLVRGTVALMENSIAVRIIERHKRMEMITQQLYVQNCTEGCCPCALLPRQDTCSPTGSTEQWYSRRSTAPETHTVKQASHSPFTDCMTGPVIQLGEDSFLFQCSHALVHMARFRLTWFSDRDALELDGLLRT
ncbi:hypothetical protein TNCV_917271 [Trichonephila clavipes]|nr:hypothetical protein TNCV_917271 [Trichonephila clavipes]